MTLDPAIALDSKAWPFEEARRILKRYENSPPEKGYVLFETGYGPSGLPHIGTFGEVVRTTMVRHAFEIISDIPTRLVCFSDDLDGMRKVPDNLPNQEMLTQHLQKPLTSVPDPFEQYSSFAAHNNAMLKRFLDSFGFEYDFISATEFYRSGQFDEILLHAAAHYDEIMKIMLASLREERQQTYSIFLPISAKTGRVLYVPIKEVNAQAGTLTYDDEGEEVTTPITGGHCKLQWKPDFAARWAALGVDFEMYGKDHATNTPLYDKICRALGAHPPERFTYELFLDERGEKISKSKGNGISIDEWLTYAPSESLSYFMYQKPKTAKRLYFDVIPKAVDEYHQQLRAYGTQEPAAQANNPVYHIHAGNPPESDMGAISYALLLNLASAVGTDDPEILWGFIRNYAHNTSPQSHPMLDRSVHHALAYVRDFIEPHKHYRKPTEAEHAALLDLGNALLDHTGDSDAQALQTLVFSIGTKHGFDPMRDWFKAIYEVLLGAPDGPRFGGFIALYGTKQTAELIRNRLAAP